MKKIVFTALLAFVVLVGSCSKEESLSSGNGGNLLRNNFVYSYIVPDYYIPYMATLRGAGKQDDGKKHPYDYYTFVMESHWADLSAGMDGKPKIAENSILSGGGVNKTLYLDYSGQIGEAGLHDEGSYKGPKMLEKVIPVQMEGITVTSNRDFDKDHPAGSDLTSMFGIRYTCPADFIKSGYSEDYIRKNGLPGYDNMTRMDLADFNARKFKNLGHRVELFLLSSPVNTLEGYTFTFIYRDADGRTHTMQSEPVAFL